MNRYSKISLCILGCLLLPIALYSQIDNFRLINKKKRITVPFEFINKNIIIPLSINDSGTLYFMLDSGLTTTLITELFPEDNITLNYASKKIIQGLGGERTLTVVTSYNNTIKLKGIIGTNQQINFITENIFSLSQLAGQKINGIIGYDILKHFVVKIDYNSKKLTFYNPKYYHKKLRGYLHFPLETKAGKPYIYADIITPEQQKKKLKFMIDTGASLSLWLMDNDSIRIPKPEKTIKSYIGQGLSGKIYGEYGRIPALLFEEKMLPNVLAAFPNPEDIKAALPRKNSGSIGSEILRRFHIVMDYPANKLHLKPNRHFKEPFSFNASGIELYQPDLQIPIYKILTLEENSLAAKAGLKIDDIVLEINGQATLLMTFEKVMNTLNTLERKKGKSIKLLIQRDTTKIELEYTIPKKDLI